MEQIEKSTYQGYLWYSDKDQPKVLNNEDLEITLDKKINPFIIEGHLFDGKQSISIKYLDGKYIVKKYILDELSEKDFTEQSFLAHRMGDVKALKFRQYWGESEGKYGRKQKDELCEGMSVLQPAVLVFVGFNDKEK